MKKHLKILVMAVAAVFLVAGSAAATLIGIGEYVGSTPDVKYDNLGRAIYGASSDLFQIYNSVDELIRLPGGSVVTLTNEYDYDPIVGFGLAISVDENGNLTGGVSNYNHSWNLGGSYSGTYNSDYDMVEVLLRGKVEVAGNTYDASSAPVLLLGAEVNQFGWENFASNLAQVDFLFGPVAGAWVNDAIWPTNLPTGAFADLAGSLDWTKNFNIENKGGDKYPVPEPATVLLMGAGLGLLGLGALRRKKLGKDA